MWWNFVARSPQEIAEARTDWKERRRFGEVTGYSGPSRSAESRQVCQSEPRQLSCGSQHCVNGGSAARRAL
jgi:hypothetical protein